MALCFQGRWSHYQIRHRWPAHTHTHSKMLRSQPRGAQATCTRTASIQSNDTSKARRANGDKWRGVRSRGCSSSVTLPRFSTASSPRLHHAAAALSGPTHTCEPRRPLGISAPQAGSCYVLLRAQWDLSVDWALSKGRHAPNPDDVLIFLYVFFFFFCRVACV